MEMNKLYTRKQIVSLEDTNFVLQELLKKFNLEFICTVEKLEKGLIDHRELKEIGEKK